MNSLSIYWWIIPKLSLLNQNNRIHSWLILFVFWVTLKHRCILKISLYFVERNVVSQYAEYINTSFWLHKPDKASPTVRFNNQKQCISEEPVIKKSHIIAPFIGNSLRKMFSSLVHKCTSAGGDYVTRRNKKEDERCGGERNESRRRRMEE